MKTQVKKAVIVAAGRGTRFLPITKTVPKEMLPIGNKPTLHYLLEECKESGIEELCIIVRERGSITEKYFERDFELEHYLKEKQKDDLLEKIRDLALGMTLTFIQQDPAFPYGHGAPVLSAENWVKNDNFGLLFCDDLVISEKPALKQLKIAWEQNPETQGIVMTDTVPYEELFRFSSVKYNDQKLKSNVKLIENYIEKPKDKSLYFSNECFFGRAVYTSEIFQYLKENLKSGKCDNQGEFSLWDAMIDLAQTKKFGGLKVQGQWITTGNPEQMKKASEIILSKNNF